MNNVDIAHQFIKIMKPLVQDGKFALQIIGEPKRDVEKEMNNEFINLAKHYKLHRKIKHSQCAIVIDYNPGKNMFHGNVIELNCDTVTFHDCMRRFVIISVLFVILVVLISKLSK